MRAERLIQKGLLDEVLEETKSKLAVSKHGDDERSTAALSLSLGLIYRYRGNLDPALDFCRRSLAKFENLEREAEMATSCNNIGLLYLEKGQLNEAVQFFQRGLVLAENTENTLEIAASLNNIGVICRMKGGFETASAQFEQSLREIGDDKHACDPLYNLIQLAILEGSLERAQKYLNSLQELDSREENKYISQVCRLAKAMILKTSDRFIKIAEAYLLLQGIAEEPSIRHSVTVEAKIGICELLILDLGISSNEDIIAELKDLLHQLLDSAEAHDNIPLLAEVYWLQSKLALLELDVKRARQLLARAQSIAEKRDLRILAKTISSEYDSLLGQLTQLDDFIDTEASMRERLDPSHLEDLVVGMIRKRVSIISEQPPEEPVMLLVLSGSGQRLFSRLFIPENQVDDQVIGGFLQAVRDIGRQIFTESEAIDRIVYKEYILAMKMRESMMFCYAFKGQSYTALQKLDQFMERIQGNPAIWDIITQDSIASLEMPSETKTEINNHVREIFHSAVTD